MGGSPCRGRCLGEIIEVSQPIAGVNAIRLPTSRRGHHACPSPREVGHGLACRSIWPEGSSGPYPRALSRPVGSGTGRSSRGPSLRHPFPACLASLQRPSMGHIVKWRGQRRQSQLPEKAEGGKISSVALGPPRAPVGPPDRGRDLTRSTSNGHCTSRLPAPSAACATSYGHSSSCGSCRRDMG